MNTFISFFLNNPNIVKVSFFCLLLRVISIFYEKNILKNSRFKISNPNDLLILKKYFELSFLITNSSMSEEVINFILNNYPSVDLKLVLLLIINQQLTEDQIVKHQDIFSKELICLYQIISDKFLKHHSNLVNWDVLSLRHKLDKIFILDYQEKINWYTIINNKSLSLSFVFDFPQQIRWDGFSRFGNLNKQVLDDFKDQINWKIIREERQLTDKEKDLLKNYDQFNMVDNLKYVEA